MSWGEQNERTDGEIMQIIAEEDAEPEVIIYEEDLVDDLEMEDLTDGDYYAASGGSVMWMLTKAAAYLVVADVFLYGALR